MRWRGVVLNPPRLGKKKTLAKAASLEIARYTSKWRSLLDAKLSRTPFVDIYEQLSVIPTTGPLAKVGLLIQAALRLHRKAGLSLLAKSRGRVEACRPPGG